MDARNFAARHMLENGLEVTIRAIHPEDKE
jgi:hypothetical protein